MFNCLPYSESDVSIFEYFGQKCQALQPFFHIPPGILTSDKKINWMSILGGKEITQAPERHVQRLLALTIFIWPLWWQFILWKRSYVSSDFIWSNHTVWKYTDWTKKSFLNDTLKHSSLKNKIQHILKSRVSQNEILKCHWNASSPQWKPICSCKNSAAPLWV